MARRAVESPESAAPDAGVLLAGFRVGAAVEAEGRSRWGCVIEGSRTVIQVAAGLVGAGEGASSVGLCRVACVGFAALGLSGAFGASDGLPKTIFGSLISVVIRRSGGEEG